MKKILFPTDFSDTARNAFDYAVQLAKQLDARIDLLSVYHIPLADAGRVPPEYIQQMLEDKKSQVEEHIRQFVSGHPEAPIGRMRVEYGLFVYQEITDVATREDYDLIVMGTRGEHSRMEKLLGSVTTHTMMQSSCPVLAVPESATFQPIDQIVYATDFHPTDDLAVAQLIRLAKEMNASVHFLHVDTRSEPGSIEDQIQLEHYPFDFTDFTVVSSHSVMEGVDEYIKKKDIQLLALFIPQRRLWERLFHSSFTKRLTFHTRIPLLVFHE